MTQKQKYQEYARNCIELSERTALPEERVKLLQMAQTWRRFAEKAEEVTALFQEGRDLGIIPPRSAMN